jgi:PilZ domain
MKSALGQDPSRLTLSGEIHLRREATDVDSLPGLAERRVKPRLKHPFPTTARGTDAKGELFELDCVLDNVSSTGVYLRLPRRMNLGAEMNVIIKFVNGRSGATAFLMTEVLRDEPQSDGNHGLALAIKDHYFL